MTAAALTAVVSHWDLRRRMAVAAADSARTNGRPTLPLLRYASRCEARINRLIELVARTSALGDMA